MGADSTVPNLDNDVGDLDWIDNIKPLNCGDLNMEIPPAVAANGNHPSLSGNLPHNQTVMTSLTNVATLTRINSISNPVMSQPYLHNGTDGPSSLRSLLIGKCLFTSCSGIRTSRSMLVLTAYAFLCWLKAS